MKKLCLILAMLPSCRMLEVETPSYRVSVQGGPFLARRVELKAEGGELVSLTVDEKTDNAGITAMGGIVATVATYLSGR